MRVVKEEEEKLEMVSQKFVTRIYGFLKVTIISLVLLIKILD